MEKKTKSWIYFTLYWWKKPSNFSVVFRTLQPDETHWNSCLSHLPRFLALKILKSTGRTPTSPRHKNEIPSLISCLTSQFAQKKSSKMSDPTLLQQTPAISALDVLVGAFSKWPPLASLLQQPNFFTCLAVNNFHTKLPCKAILLHFPNRRAKGWKIPKGSPCAPLGTSSHPSGRPSRKPHRFRWRDDGESGECRHVASQDGTFGYWSNSKRILLENRRARLPLPDVTRQCAKIVSINVYAHSGQISSAGSLYRKLPVVSKIRKNLQQCWSFSAAMCWKELQKLCYIYIHRVLFRPVSLPFDIAVWPTGKIWEVLSASGDPSGTAFSSSSSSEPHITRQRQRQTATRNDMKRQKVTKTPPASSLATALGALAAGVAFQSILFCSRKEYLLEYPSYLIPYVFHVKFRIWKVCEHIWDVSKTSTYDHCWNLVNMSPFSEQTIWQTKIIPSSTWIVSSCYKWKTKLWGNSLELQLKQDPLRSCLNFSFHHLHISLLGITFAPHGEGFFSPNQNINDYLQSIPSRTEIRNFWKF